MKNVNTFMSSCATRNLFQQNPSPRTALQLIPYKHLEQIAPPWSASQLKSSKSAKSGKFQWNTSISPWVPVRFTLCFDGIQSPDLLYNSSQISVLAPNTKYPRIEKTFELPVNPKMTVGFQRLHRCIDSHGAFDTLDTFWRFWTSLRAPFMTWVFLFASPVRRYEISLEKI